MFYEHDKRTIRKEFTVREIDIALENLDELVEQEFMEPYNGELEWEEYYIIPMGEHGVAFDIGDTSSGGVPLYNVEPYGSKKMFKVELEKALKAIKEVLWAGSIMDSTKFEVDNLQWLVENYDFTENNMNKLIIDLEPMLQDGVDVVVYDVTDLIEKGHDINSREELSIYCDNFGADEESYELNRVTLVRGK